MDDREMLEWAAKAAGIVVVRCRLDDPACRDMLIENSQRNPFQRFGPWNPLSDDGDSLRLAVKLNMGISIHTGHCSAVAQVGFFCEERGKDTEVTTRRAIVRAAAEIGKAMP